MRIDVVNNTNFTSHSLAESKNSMITRIRSNQVIKPIKNYSQYLKEYGLDLVKIGKK